MALARRAFKSLPLPMIPIWMHPETAGSRIRSTSFQMAQWKGIQVFAEPWSWFVGFAGTGPIVRSWETDSHVIEVHAIVPPEGLPPAQCPVESW